jgi:hypothetical protein
LLCCVQFVAGKGERTKNIAGIANRQPGTKRSRRSGWRTDMRVADLCDNIHVYMYMHMYMHMEHAYTLHPVATGLEFFLMTGVTTIKIS